MEIGQKYKLITFNGTHKPLAECETNENYWILIGQIGTVVKFSNEKDFSNKKRVLIQFDKAVEKQGLICHNSVPNALWILKTDLEKSTCGNKVKS